MDNSKKKAEYRNSIRSKTLIRNALLSLMQEKEFEKITVTDIVSKADINRGTFYAHFASPGEVLAKIQHDFFSGVESLFRGVNPEDLIRNPYPILEQVNHYISQDIEFYRLLLSVSVITKLTEKYSRGLAIFLSDESLLKKVKNPREYKIAIYFVVSGVLSLYLDALENFGDVELEELPHTLATIVKNVVGPCFK